jgi:hypothetical protein
MTDYKCQNGDVIRVGGVYIHNKSGRMIAVSRIDSGIPWLVRFIAGSGDEDGYMPDSLSSEFPRDSDGFYIWGGDARPVPDDWVVEVKYGGIEAQGKASNYFWGLSFSENLNIKAFRVISTSVHDAAESINNEQGDNGEAEVDVQKVSREAGFMNAAPRSAGQFLHQAAELMAERGKEYDKPNGERSTGKAVHAFNAITGRDLTEAEGWLFMSLVKRVRQYSSPKYHKDSAEDGVAYAALEAEALERGE